MNISRFWTTVFLLKDLSDYERIPGIIVSETSTSQHDTGQIGEMFYLPKCNFKQIFDAPLTFKYVVSEFCWRHEGSNVQSNDLFKIVKYIQIRIKYVQ